MLGHPHLLLYRHSRALPRRGTRAMAGGCAMIARRESLLAPMPRAPRPRYLLASMPMIPGPEGLLAPMVHIENNESLILCIGFLIGCSAIKGHLVLDIVQCATPHDSHRHSLEFL